MKKISAVILVILLLTTFASAVTLKADLNKDMEISYDNSNGQIPAAMGCQMPAGYGVNFTLPSEEWYALKQVRFYGNREADSRFDDLPFFVEVWDNSSNVLRSLQCKYSDYFQPGESKWVTVNISNAFVHRDFFVFVFPNMAKVNDSIAGLLTIGMDNGTPYSGRSYEARKDNHTISLKMEQVNLHLRAIVTLLYDTEIAYENGTEYGYLDKELPDGFGVRFTPPSGGCILTQVKFYGYRRAPETFDNLSFFIEVWDGSFKVLSNLTYRYINYFEKYESKWVTIDIPDVSVNSDFYVCIFPNEAKGPYYPGAGAPYFLGIIGNSHQPFSNRSCEVNKDTTSITEEMKGINLLIRVTISSMVRGPTTVRVPEDYATIQEAINAAIDGDTILVARGIYREQITVNKSIGIIGAGADSTTIESNAKTSMNVTADNVAVSNLSFKASTAEELADGIEIHSNGNHIFNNTILRTSNGIDVFGSNNTIESNNFQDYLWGIVLGKDSQNNTIADNGIEGGIYGGINGTNSQNNAIANNIFVYCSTGVYLENSTNNRIADNNLTDCSTGIYLEDSTNNKLQRNVITGGEKCIFLHGSSDKNEIVENNLYGASYAGLYNCGNGNSIVNNTIVQLPENKKGWSIVIEGQNNIFDHNNVVNSNSEPLCWGVNANYSYPFGGNYWSDYSGVDLYSGPYQNSTGSDGIGDTPYRTDYYRFEDRYPLMQPLTYLPDPIPPKAVVGAPEFAVSGQTFFVNASGSFDNVKIQRYFWEIKNAMNSVAWGYSKISSFTLNTYLSQKSITYTITLTIWDYMNNSDRTTTTITVLSDKNNDGIPDVADNDDDGMPNLWETKYGLDPNNASDAGLDPDKDLLTNLEEYRMGTNPREHNWNYKLELNLVYTILWILVAAIAALAGMVVAALHSPIRRFMRQTKESNKTKEKIVYEGLAHGLDTLSQKVLSLPLPLRMKNAIKFIKNTLVLAPETRETIKFLLFIEDNPKRGSIENPNVAILLWIIVLGASLPITYYLVQTVELGQISPVIAILAFSAISAAVIAFFLMMLHFYTERR